MRPLDLSPRSSDEYAPVLPSPVVVEAARRAREALHDLVRSRAVSRSRPLHVGRCVRCGALGAERMLCGGEGEQRDRAAWRVVRAADDDRPAAASSVLDREDLVVDVQLHFLDPARNGSNFGGGFPQAACGASDPKLCFTQDTFLDLVFAQSDTQVGVLSGLPFAGKDSPLAVDVIEHARERLAEQANGRRLLLQAGAFPATGPLQAALDQMASDAATYPVAAWKTYTHAPTSYRLDDERGDALLSQAVALGIPILAVHKGISGEDPAASPVDIGPAAAAHPEATLVVYHSGWEPNAPEGPYRADTPAERQRGVDRLVTSLRDNAIGPGGNVYAELGSTWFNLTRNLDAAAHVLGKLLVQLGPERILWGTDSIWYGSPQGQIDAFRGFDDQRGVPGAVRLSRADRRDQSADPRRERRPALRHQLTVTSRRCAVGASIATSPAASVAIASFSAFVRRLRSSTVSVVASLVRATRHSASTWPSTRTVPTTKLFAMNSTAMFVSHDVGAVRVREQHVVELGKESWGCLDVRVRSRRVGKVEERADAGRLSGSWRRDRAPTPRRPRPGEGNLLHRQANPGRRRAGAWDC